MLWPFFAAELETHDDAFARPRKTTVCMKNKAVPVIFVAPASIHIDVISRKDRQVASGLRK